MKPRRLAALALAGFALSTAPSCSDEVTSDAPATVSQGGAAGSSQQGGQAGAEQAGQAGSQQSGKGGSAGKQQAGGEGGAAGKQQAGGEGGAAGHPNSGGAGASQGGAAGGSQGGEAGAAQGGEAGAAQGGEAGAAQGGGAGVAGSSAGGDAGSGGQMSTGGAGGGQAAGAAGAAGQVGEGCGYMGLGTVLEVSADIEVCLPRVVCTAETCPPPLGDCVDGACVWKGDYKGLSTLPEAWATYYCTLSTGGCHGVTQIEFPEVTAAKIGQGLGLPLCEQDPTAPTCVGIAAAPPTMVGNSQVAIDPSTGGTVSGWGLGMTEASGLCYELSGPGGTVLVALTDRCGGYCSCNGSGYQECGPCVSAADMAPNCPCVGTAPGLWGECCGNGCGQTKQDCDWCASSNHPHFDLDTAAFNKLCGAEASQGSCRLGKAKPVSCLAPLAWPPGGGSASCKANSFACTESPAPEQPKVPGVDCCCNWGLTPQPDGSCG